MLDVDVVGEGAGATEGALAAEEIAKLCQLAAAARGLHDGHVAVEFVSEQRIAQLNRAHRSKAGPTDVLSFPIDELAELPGGEERELGDIVICPARTEDLREAVVHGMLHLLGMDHERDDGEMLTLQRELLAAAREDKRCAGRTERARRR